MIVSVHVATATCITNVFVISSNHNRTASSIIDETVIVSNPSRKKPIIFWFSGTPSRHSVKVIISVD